jgi:hypothetical protein
VASDVDALAQLFSRPPRIRPALPSSVLTMANGLYGNSRFQWDGLTTGRWIAMRVPQIYARRNSA